MRLHVLAVSLGAAGFLWNGGIGHRRKWRLQDMHRVIAWGECRFAIAGVSAVGIMLRRAWADSPIVASGALPGCRVNPGGTIESRTEVARGGDIQRNGNVYAVGRRGHKSTKAVSWSPLSWSWWTVSS